MMQLVEQEAKVRFSNAQDTASTAAFTSATLRNDSQNSALISANSSGLTGKLSIKTQATAPKKNFDKKVNSAFRVRAKTARSRGASMELDEYVSVESLQEVLKRTPKVWTKLQNHIKSFDNV